MIRWALMLVLGLLACPAWATARDIFVDNSGGDDRSGGQAPDYLGTGGPTRTIAKALRIARPGDRVSVSKVGGKSVPMQEA